MALIDQTTLPRHKEKRFYQTPGVCLKSDFSNADRSKNYVLLEADSIDAYLKWQAECESTTSGWRESRSASAKQSWDLKAGWDGFQTLLSDGWPKGVAKLKTAVAALPSSIGFGRIPDSDVCGDSLNIPAFVAGDPCHWDCDPDEDASLGQTKVIRLIVPVGALAGYDADYLYNRGAAVVACIRSIEAAGYQCEVWAESASKSAPEAVCQRVKVKHAGASLDLNNLAVWLAHPAAFRRGFFSGRECLWSVQTPQGSVDGLLGGYGGTCYGPTEGLEAGSIYLPLAAHGRHSTPQASLETLSAVFTKAGFLLKFN
jgi:hypothetical protein